MVAQDMPGGAMAIIPARTATRMVRARSWIRTVISGAMNERPAMGRDRVLRDHARVLVSHAVEARWLLGDGSLLLIALNLHEQPVPYRAATGIGEEHLLFETPATMVGLREGVLPGDGLVALLMPSAPAQA